MYYQWLEKIHHRRFNLETSATTLILFNSHQQNMYNNTSINDELGPYPPYYSQLGSPRQDCRQPIHIARNLRV